MTVGVRTKLLVSAGLDDFTTAEDEENVAVANGAEAMSYNNRGTALHGAIKSLLHNFLALFIQSGSGLVKDQDPWVLDESTGDSDTLLLTARELSTLDTTFFREAFM